MKASRPTSALFAALSALALLGTVALTGCSSSALTGPDTSPQVEAVEGGSMTGNAEGEQGGGGTTHTASHNTMPSDD